MKILLGQLNSNGDCLFATVIARQVKEVDYPDCHLTWAVNSKCRQTVELNPYVDEIWEIPTEKAVSNQEEWEDFIRQVEKRKAAGDFDLFFPTQIVGENWIKYDGGVRSSIYANYPHEIRVSDQPIINLSEQEIENVRRFRTQYQLEKYDQVVLVECGPDSFEASLNPQKACELAIKLSADFKNTAFILSSNKPVASDYPHIIDGSRISFRENAELAKYCDLFIGCGSGISWLTTTNWAKKINSILIINSENPILPSVAFDHKFIGLPVDHLIEIKDSAEALNKLEMCFREIRKSDFATARAAFNETIELTNFSELRKQLRYTLIKKDFRDFFLCLKRYARRNGVKMFFTAEFKNTLLFLSNLLVKKVSKS